MATPDRLYDSEGNELFDRNPNYQVTPENVQKWATAMGYKGPAEHASGFLVQGRDEKGNLIPAQSMFSGNNQDAWHKLGISDNPLQMQQILKYADQADPEASSAVRDEWSKRNPDGAWGVASKAAPFAFAGGMAGMAAGAAAAAGSAGAASGATEIGAVGGGSLSAAGGTSAGASLGATEAAAAGAAGGAAGGTIASSGAETFVDPWDVMGDPSAYGLNSTPGANPGTPMMPEPTGVPTNPGGIDPGWVPQTVYNPTTGLAESATQKTGLIDSVMNWAKANPTLASTAVQVGGGFIRDAFAPSPEEQARAQFQAKLDAEKAWLDWIQTHNSLAGVNVNRLKPTNAQLRRGGIISRARA